MHLGYRFTSFILSFMLFTLLGCEEFSADSPSNTNNVANAVVIYADTTSAKAQFAVDELEAALSSADYTVTRMGLDAWQAEQNVTKIILFTATEKSLSAAMSKVTKPLTQALIPEGFALQQSSSTGLVTWVKGFDEAGVMYGGFELAEQISLYGLQRLQAGVQNPYMEKRGTKFNIPLDARTPSYSDMSDVAQENMKEVWDYQFWTDYIDHLARYRYNFVSLWNLHPFPSMVRVPDYPEVALDDVKQITAPFDEHYSTQARGYDTPELMKNLKTIVHMTMDEKIVFWRKVMQYAADRNIKFYVVTWNIFDYGTEGKYGITDKIDNPITIDYFRKSVKEMFVAYPLLAGVGLTTGENMPDANFMEKEEWAYKTYGLGVLDAAKEFPEREITFIHRQHQAGAQAIAKQFKSLLDQDNIDFIFSFKYAQAHVYSSTTQHYHPEFVNDIGDMKTIWTLRNDDVYLYRWGAPDFVREFIQNIPYDVGRGYYYGSDQYVWGREFLSLTPEAPRELELSKHWYQWLLWGRLGFNPSLSNERLAAIVGQRFPEVETEKLFSAWQEASMVYPVVTGFHWGQYDFQWYIEASKSRPGPAQTESGFHDVNRFINLPPHESTNYLSIPDYVASTIHKKKLSANLATKITPLEVAELLHKHADEALMLVTPLRAKNNKVLDKTLQDIKTIAFLGKHYGYKIAGATQLALYRTSKQSIYQQEAIKQLTLALEYWKKYTASSETLYENPFWTNRVGHVNWHELTQEVAKDIDIAKVNLLN